ncbi:acetate--CoA ligase family protein [Nonomuraea sp. NPDC049269]|uniref:acetate--CoA ligase family protein n=1 Tax=Nonomuraea sp. NPDC049269 TaxID=3364349 RepID=UPI00371B393F
MDGPVGESAPGASRDVSARDVSARLRALLSPKSVALVGASDRLGWSTGSFANFARLGFEGSLHLVNRNGGEVHGRPSVTSCTEIGEPVDLALMLVGANALPVALADAAAAGIRSVVVLAAGFGETGHEGVRAQQELAERCRELGLMCVGPNCLGFVNVVDRAPAWSGPMPSVAPGGVAVVSQSGATAYTIASFAARQNIGLSHVISTGNEAMVDTVDMAAAVLEDDRVRSVAMFMESIRDVGSLRRLAARAAELRKPIVVMKVGTSALAAEIALTHTGALVGDDRLVDAALRQFGVVRVGSLEQLAITAGLLARTGPLVPGGLGVVSISGGACDIIADRAEIAGVPLEPLAEETQERLSRLLPSYGALRNPLDITGAASENPQLFADALAVFADDPSVALLAAVYVLPTEQRSERIRHKVEMIAKGLRAAGGRGVLMDQTFDTISPHTAAELERMGVPHALTGLRDSIDAIGAAMRWSAWLRRRRMATQAETGPQADGHDGPSREEIGGTWPSAVAGPPPEAGDGPWSEARGLGLLAEHGIPVVPWRAAATREEAVAAARELGYPVVLKVVSPQILHKSDIGGVALGLRTDAEVGQAFDRVTAAGARVAGAHVEGALVAPMRAGGLELIVGLVRDAHWGPTLAVGFGGVWVHVADDTSLRLLPVDESDVRDMLGELRGKALLEGVRGSAPVDLDGLVRVIVDFARMAGRLGPGLASIEINPLRVDGAEIEALDAAVLWL